MPRRSFRSLSPLVFSLVLAASGCTGNVGGSSSGATIASVVPDSGSTLGGTSVIISGANFQSGATVKFGTAPAIGVAVDSASQLSATSPPGTAGSVAVTVTNPGGQFAVLPNAFTYDACSVPSTVTSNLTLDASCVWTVSQTVVVAGPNSPVLTVQPGTTVTFASGSPVTALRVGVDAPGSLLANGTSAAPVIFTSGSATPDAGDWGGIVLGPQSTGSSIAYTTVEYAGGSGANDLQETAALTVEGGDVVGTSPGSSASPMLTQLTISSSAGHGLVFAGLNAGFGAGSADITVTSWEMTAHYPFVLEANQGATVPTSLSAPSTPPGLTAGVAFRSYVNSECNVVTSQTWQPLSLPILAECSIGIGSASGPVATLTISAPNTLKFAPSTELDVDPEALGSGRLQANGKDSSSGAIVFTSSLALPDAGAWGGLNFNVVQAGQGGSSLTYATVNYANSTLLAPPPSYGTGAISVSNATGNANALTGPTIANCAIQSYPSYGIALVDISSGNFTSYGQDNTFATPGMTVSSFCSEVGEPNCTDTGAGP